MADNHSHSWTPIYDADGVEIIGRVCTDSDCQASEGRMS